MANWRQLGAIWQLRPAEPTGLIEFIGGSYLAAEGSGWFPYYTGKKGKLKKSKTEGFMRFGGWE